MSDTLIFVSKLQRYMYTEILRIIEGGLARDPKKVYSYSKLLAKKMNSDGEDRMSKMILNALNHKMATTVTMDELLSVPIDQESRMNIADIALPSKDIVPIVLPKMIETQISDFISTVKYQGELVKKGVNISNTLLLYGDPGCGKTMVAQYISEQTGLPLVVARFDAIVSSLLGSTAKNIRRIFDFADKRPCILFLDEFDAIAKARDDQHELGELKRVINSLLQNIDTFSSQNILIAATNHPKLLDKAIWRRFNTVLEMGAPEKAEIVKLIKIFVGGFSSNFIEDDKKLEKLADLFSSKSPSEIKTIINNSKSKVVINHRDQLQYEDVLIELYNFDHRRNVTVDKFIHYLYDNGVSQAEIAERTKISLRQVRNILIS